MKKPRDAIIVPVLFIILSVLVYWPVFSSGRLPGGELSDTVHQGYPFFAFTEASLRQGELPLWNPYIYGGLPFYASFSAPVFYPLRGLPLLLFGGEAAIRFLFPVHLVLAGCFTWLFMGSLGVSRPGRYAGASAYALGAWANTLFYAGHGSKVICWAYLPLLLYALKRYNDTRRVKWIGAGALAVGMQGLSSHPQMVLYSGMIAFVFALWHMGRPRQWLWKASGFAGMMLLGAAVSAVQLYPGYLFSRESTRGEGLDPETAASYSMPPEETLTMILPSAYGLRHGFPDSSISGIPVYFGRLGLRLSSEFTGVAVFLMAMAGLLRGKNGNSRRALLTLVLLGAAVSWGGYTPVFDVLYRFVPIFRRIRAPHMAAFITATSLAFAAGPGFDAFLAEKAFRKKILIPGGAVILFLLLLSISGPLSRTLQATWWRRMGVPGGAGFDFLTNHRASLLRADLFRALLSSSGLLMLLYAGAKLGLKPGLVSAGFIVICGLELVPFNRSFQVYLHQTSIESLFIPDPGLEEAAGSGRVFPGGNQLVPLGIRSVSGYHAAKPGITDRLASLIDPPTPENLHQLGVTAFRLPEGTFTWEELHPVLSEESPTLPRYPMPRAFIPTQPVPGTREQGFTLLARGANPTKVSVIDAPPRSLPSVCSGTAEIILDTPHEVIVETRSSSIAVLVLADTWYPRWRAEVNGNPTEIHTANGWMRSVILPAGLNTVRFRYDDSDVILGLWISMASLTAALAILLIPSRRRNTR